MDLRLIQKLVRMMTRAELSEIEIDDTASGLRVHLRRDSGQPQSAPLVHVMQGAGPAAAAPMPAAHADPYAPAPGGGSAAAAPGTKPFVSPMVGTFYRSPSPETGPFVEVGQSVGEDTVLCIIEAMKVMNEIKAEMRGTIAEILVENGEPVEYGQPLFLLKTS